MRLEGECVLELGAYGDGIGRCIRVAFLGFFRVGQFILYGIIHDGVRHDCAGGTGRLHHGHCERHSGLYLGIILTAAGDDSAGVVDVYVGDGIIGHGDLGPPVAGDGVDALVPNGRKGFYARDGLEGEGVFGAGVGLVREAGEGEGQGEFGLFATQLLSVGEGFTVGKPEDLEADGVGPGGLVVDGKVGHALGLELLGVEDGAVFAEDAHHGAGGAGSVAEAGRHCAGDGFRAGKENAVYALRDGLVGRSQDEEAHFGAAFGLVAGMGIGLYGINACRDALKGDFDGFSGLCASAADTLDFVIHVKGHFAAGIVPYLKVKAEDILRDDGLLHAGTPPAPSIDGLVLEGEFAVGLVENTYAD